MIEIYIDKWGRWHDKPTDGIRPSSNNGWIYTAYAKKLGFEILQDRLMACMKESMFQRADGKFTFLRSPGKLTPPLSRDEVLGMVFLKAVQFRDSWYFGPYVVPSFNPFKTIAALWKMRNRHRNAIWTGEGEPHLWRFAFSVPLQDRAFILRTQGFDVPWYYALIEFLDSKLKGSTDSSKLIRQLKYEKSLDNETVIRYFGQQHPFAL